MMWKYALVSTVDSMDAGFPSHCVMLFESEREAVQHAVGLIEKFDESVQYIQSERIWKMAGNEYVCQEDLLEAWQDGLDITEYFHVKPIQHELASFRVAENGRINGGSGYE